MPEESEKSEQDSPLKEPLKKKGNDIHNPYPNFKVRKICDINYMADIVWLILYESLNLSLRYAEITFRYDFEPFPMMYTV